MSGSGLHQLHRAIERNAEVALSLPAGRDLHHYRSHILGGCDGGFWVNDVAHAKRHVDRLIESRATIGLSFEDDRGHKLLTVSRILQRGSERSASALLLEYPRTLEHAQRRNDYRVTAPSGASLSIRVWAAPVAGNLPAMPAGDELSAQVLDLSAGGVAFLFRPDDAASLRMNSEQLFRVLLTFGREQVLLAARLRYLLRQPDGSVRLGLQFQFTGENAENVARLDRARLLRMITHLRRVECRRHRHRPASLRLSA